jgi:hypothetical protein
MVLRDKFVFMFFVPATFNEFTVFIMLCIYLLHKGHP